MSFDLLEKVWATCSFWELEQQLAEYPEASTKLRKCNLILDKLYTAGNTMSAVLMKLQHEKLVLSGKVDELTKQRDALLAQLDYEDNTTT